MIGKLLTEEAPLALRAPVNDAPDQGRRDRHRHEEKGCRVRRGGCQQPKGERHDGSPDDELTGRISDVCDVDMRRETLPPAGLGERALCARGETSGEGLRLIGFFTGQADELRDAFSRRLKARPKHQEQSEPGQPDDNQNRHDYRQGRPPAVGVAARRSTDSERG